jgi:hypothetical protein
MRTSLALASALAFASHAALAQDIEALERQLEKAREAAHPRNARATTHRNTTPHQSRRISLILAAACQR